MKRVRRKLYCWLGKPGEWRLGRYPPDVPIGPWMTFSTMEEVEQSISPKYEIIWCGDALATRERLLSFMIR